MRLHLKGEKQDNKRDILVVTLSSLWNYNSIIYREETGASITPPASWNNTQPAGQQVFTLRWNYLFETSQLRINYRRLQLSSTPNVILQSEVRAIGNTTLISEKLLAANEEPIKATLGKVKASVLQNLKLKHAVAQYISRLRKGESKRKGEPIRRDPRMKGSLLRSR